jgi:hypothetical protein
MKWIGQLIYEDISTGTIASGGNLGLDSNNKIVKATEASGDITAVAITTDSGSGSRGHVASGDADFSILGANGVGITNSGTTITAVAVPGEIDHDSLSNFAANEHFTQANITTVGTIGTGVWQGTAINATYLDGQSGTNTGDETLSSINGLSITTVGVIDTGEWRGTAIASAYLDADTAHLTTAQTFTGAKTFGTTTKLQFRDANAYINSPDANDLEIAATDITLDAAGTVTVEADSLVVNSTNANDPLINIINDANDSTSGRLRFLNRRGADGQDNDETGIIEFFSFDDGTPAGERYSRIIGTIHDATAGQESGKLTFQVASHDGEDVDGLVITGGDAEDVVDVTIGNGTTSVTQVAGALVEHGRTRIKILPSDFIADDGGRPVMIDDINVGSERLFLETHGANPAYATIDIPTGYKAERVMIYGASTSPPAVEVWEFQIDTNTGVSKGTGNVDTEINITDVTSTATNYLFIQVSQASGDEIHGGYVTIDVA